MKKYTWYEDFKDFINGLGPSCKFLMVIGTITLGATCLSIFDTNLDATGNLVTIRTVFSSIVGYILEKSTRTCKVDKLLLKNKVLIVGSMSVIFTIVVLFSYLLDINVNNPSLILIKNLLYSSVGFLISSSNEG
ncbi:hypothetical protein [Clostridium sp.]|uniref:hypothetical protein n=1 Tax=Clostridium sp. TaxID=1506 RepID=UPI003EE696D1